MILKPHIFSKFSEISAAQSTRLGGLSKAPYSSCNLGLSVGDLPETVHENRKIFFEHLGLTPSQVSFSHQVHEAEILQVTAPGNYTGYDAQTTNTKGVGLAVSIADCCPILIYDNKNQAIAAIHAGWRGTNKQIVAKTLAKMQETFGTKPNDCYAFVGVCITAEVYEVSDEVAENFKENQKFFNEKTGKIHINLKQANCDQLTDFGISISHIEIANDCTYLQNSTYFSHRKESGTTGRMLAAIVLN